MELLDDSLDGLFEDFGRERSPQKAEALADVSIVPAKPVFVEKCHACRGTGVFTGWSGRIVGKCFKCKGTGHKTFKRSAEERQKSRESGAQRLAKRTQEWMDEHPAEINWLKHHFHNNDFAGSLFVQLSRKGFLTDNQVAAIQRNIVRDAERAQQKAEATAEREANAPVVSVDPIITAFQNAIEHGVRRPKLRLADFEFSRAPDHGKNPGAIYVKDRRDEQPYLGKIVAGKFIRSRDCTDDVQDQIVAVCADPHQAAIAYGRRYGSCSVCGRELTKHASIDAGIGPVCASKYGWA